jgi:predicted amidohydrolase
MVIPLIVTLHQINTIVGDFDGNLQKIIRGARHARGKGSSLAVFPELSLTGYPPLDLLENRAFIFQAGQALDRLVRASSSGRAASFLPISRSFSPLTMFLTKVVTSSPAQL